jgi:hypothetical protein
MPTRDAPCVLVSLTNSTCLSLFGHDRKSITWHQGDPFIGVHALETFFTLQNSKTNQIFGNSASVGEHALLRDECRHRHHWRTQKRGLHRSWCLCSCRYTASALNAILRKIGNGRSPVSAPA